MDFSRITLPDLASLIFTVLKENGINAVLVGGACVSIYSENQYQSYDLDFVSYESIKTIEKPLSKLGFKRKGRYFSHERCPYLIDFVNPPIAVGQEPIKKFKTLKIKSGSLMLLTPEDCVKDRLAAFFHWDDMQALEQALMVAKKHSVNIDAIQSWAKEIALKSLSSFKNVCNHDFLPAPITGSAKAVGVED